jgi:TPR repeat protein
MTPPAMKKIVFCLTLLVAGAVCADELADANALFEKKSYPQALQLYTRLANAGNAEAQLHLGEMYWYGEAGEVDNAKAEAWFRKSSAKGNKTAAAALEVMKQRVARRAEIDYWLSKYDGADLKSGQFRCPAPRIPAISKMNEEIEAVTARVAAWQDCYNGFARNLNESSPLVKRIPPDVAALMNKQEVEQAGRYLGEVYERIAEDAKVSAKLVLADVGAWRSATDAYVTEHNMIIKNGPSAERQQDIDARKRNYAPGK